MKKITAWTKLDNEPNEILVNDNGYEVIENKSGKLGITTSKEVDMEDVLDNLSEQDLRSLAWKKWVIEEQEVMRCKVRGNLGIATDKEAKINAEVDKRTLATYDQMLNLGHITQEVYDIMVASI